MGGLQELTYRVLRAAAAIEGGLPNPEFFNSHRGKPQRFVSVHQSVGAD